MLSETWDDSEDRMLREKEERVKNLLTSYVRP
jgi:hypothetical protein